MKPKRIGLGPHTVTRIRRISENTRRDKDTAVPSSQLRTALMGATADITRVGAANKPASATCKKRLNDGESRLVRHTLRLEITTRQAGEKKELLTD